MNISFARRVQLSIMDESRPFGMAGWRFCIAGHCRMVTCGGVLGHYDERWDWEPGNMAQCALGITKEEANELFTSIPIGETANRASAVRRIDALIAKYEPSLRCKAPSRSPSATQQPVELTPSDLFQAEELVCV